MWYSRVSSHGVSWAQAGPSATLGIRLAAWPRSPGTGCGVLFRWCLLGSSGHTGPSGRSSIGFHGASPLGAASSITNQCVLLGGWSLAEEGRQWAASFEMGVPSPFPSPFFSGGRSLPASAQVPLSGASLQPLTLQNKRERERLDRRSEREKRALYNQDGALASLVERSGHSSGREGCVRTQHLWGPRHCLHSWGTGMWPEPSLEDPAWVAAKLDVPSPNEMQGIPRPVAKN